MIWYFLLTRLATLDKLTANRNTKNIGQKHSTGSCLVIFLKKSVDWPKYSSRGTWGAPRSTLDGDYPSYGTGDFDKGFRAAVLWWRYGHRWPPWARFCDIVLDAPGTSGSCHVLEGCADRAWTRYGAKNCPRLRVRLLISFVASFPRATICRVKNYESINNWRQSVLWKLNR